MTVGNAEQLVSTVYEEDQTPYVFRTAGGSIDIGDRMIDKLVGGSIAWNQIADLQSTASETFDADTSTYYGSFSTELNRNLNTISGHVYLALAYVERTISTNNLLNIYLGAMNNIRVFCGDGEPNGYFSTITVVNNATSAKRISYNNYSGKKGFSAGDSISVSNVSVFDLTQMFGSVVADYIYSIETAHAGAGVEFFKKMFPKSYYAYNAGTLMHVSGLQSHDTIGFNAYNPTTGTAKLIGGNEYQITGTYTSLSLDGTAITPDANGKFTPSANGTLTVTGGGADTCIHLVWDGERDDDYEEYVKHSYPLDSDLVLRGVPKLDVSNNLYFDGDVYEADGTVTRKYGFITYDGSSDESWSLLSTTESLDIYKIDISGAVSIANDDTSVRIASNYMTVSAYTATHTGRVANSVALVSSTRVFYTVPTGTYVSVDAMKSALASNPIDLVFELATPTTETADPFTNPQIVDDFGTEEYVVTTEEDVIVPVGHVTKYQPNLRAKLEMLPDSPDGDGDYVVRHSNGKNTYVAVTKELPTVPSEDGTYVLKCTVSDGTATLSWESAT